MFVVVYVCEHIIVDVCRVVDVVCIVDVVVIDTYVCMRFLLLL